MSDDARPLHIQLRGQPGALHGTLRLGGLEFPLASWRQGGDAGHVIARTEGGLQITIAIEREADGTRSGGMCIGETRYVVHSLVVDGLTISGVAEDLHDPWWESWKAVIGEHVERARKNQQKKGSL